MTGGSVLIILAPNQSDKFEAFTVSIPFGSLFGRSPIRPIQQHMAKTYEAATGLHDFFEAVFANDWSRAAQVQAAIGKLEGEADDMKKSIRLHLPKSLFLPVPRSDLLDLVTVQDKIANVSKDIAGLMLGRKMRIPDSLATPMMEYVDAAIATSAQALKAIQELDELLETGFAGREVGLLEDLITELEDLEHRTDKLQVEVRAGLFVLEGELPPVDVMFLYKIIDWIGDLADRAERVGSRLQVLLAR